MRIGYIGIGVMGSRMVERFLQGNYEVAIFNRTQKKMEPLIKKGAIPTYSIEELTEQCDIICTCLSMPKDVEEVYHTILSHAKAGTICVDFTTVNVETSIKLAEQAQEKGVSYLDAPVSGGPEGVEQGTLTIMIGGDKAAYEKVHPILQTIGANIHHLGASGNGSVAKLLNQYLVAVHSLAASEAMVAGAYYGIPSEKLFAILTTSYGDSHMLRRHMGNHVLKRDFSLGGELKYMLKDISIANKLLENAGLKEKTGVTAEKAFAAAVDQGYSESDMSAVILPLEKQCNVVVKDSKLT